jgi:hypothetical protein
LHSLSGHTFLSLSVDFPSIPSLPVAAQLFVVGLATLLWSSDQFVSLYVCDWHAGVIVDVDDGDVRVDMSRFGLAAKTVA